MSPLLVEVVLSPLLSDGSDADASRRSVGISSLLLADVATAARCCDALGACRVANNEA